MNLNQELINSIRESADLMEKAAEDLTFLETLVVLTEEYRNRLIDSMLDLRMKAASLRALASYTENETPATEYVALTKAKESTRATLIEKWENKRNAATSYEDLEFAKQVLKHL